MSFNFLRYRKIYYFLCGILFLAGISSVFVFGLNIGIDFTGGSILEVEFSASGGQGRPENTAVQEKLKDLNLGDIILQPTGEQGMILRFKDVEEPVHQSIILKLQELSPLQEKRFEAIGPLIGRELREKTIILVILSVAALLIYIIIGFRQVSRFVAGWQYGLVSIAALIFDILITLGILAYLGKAYNVQFNIPVVTALLTILGYAINDKIIIFDRIRENLLKSRGAENFSDLINRSLNETLARSLVTGICTLLVLFAIFLFGGETLKFFALTLIIGIAAGTFSSLFLASPLLALWVNSRRR